jgi:hypothetical protein
VSNDTSRPPSPPSRDEIPEEELEEFDAAARRLEQIEAYDLDPNVAKYYQSSLLNSPVLCRHLNLIGKWCRARGESGVSYSHTDREFVDQVLCADWKMNQILPLHLPDAVAQGVRIEAIRALRAGREEELTDDERLLAAFIRGVANGAMTDELWARMVERIGKRGTVEYAIFIAYLVLIIRLYQTFDVPSPTEADIDQLVNDIASGARGVPAQEDAKRLHVG